MSAKAFWWVLLFAALASLRSLPARAAGPWDKLLVFKRMEADPDKDYKVTEDNGPWMIMAVTFVGENAEKDARNLVLELRKKYKLPAYQWEKDLDFSSPVVGRGVDKYGGKKMMKYQRAIKTREIAVLVGNYQSVDDPAAQRTLKRLKYARPECMKAPTAEDVDKVGRIGRPFASWRTKLNDFNEKYNVGVKVGADNNCELIMWEKSTKEKNHRGPMAYAFVVTNPLLPHEFFVPNGIDKTIVRANKDVENCLLDCPGRYSVQIATFKGGVIQDKRITEENQGLLPNKLADAAEKAHRLTQILRKKGYDAYEFHDRYASIVTVGSFDSVGTKRQDGKIEIDPQVHTIMETFGAGKPDVIQAGFPSMGAAGIGKPKVIGGITLDIQPVPVAVPRRSVSNDYERSEE